MTAAVMCLLALASALQGMAIVRLQRRVRDIPMEFIDRLRRPGL